MVRRASPSIDDANTAKVLSDGGAHPRLLRHIQALAATGLYGHTPETVIVRLVEQAAGRELERFGIPILPAKV